MFDNVLNVGPNQYINLRPQWVPFLGEKNYLGPIFIYNNYKGN